MQQIITQEAVNSDSIVFRPEQLAERDTSHDTALHLAAHAGSEHLLKLMLKDGYDMKARSAEGFTVLHFAAIGRNFKALNILIDAGADMKAKDHYGRDFRYYLLCSEPTEGSC